MDNLPKGRSAFPAQAEIGTKQGRGVGHCLPQALCTREWCEYHQYCTDFGLNIPVKWISKTKDTPGYHIYEDGKNA